MTDHKTEETISRLERRVDTLEAALKERSRELRLLQEHLCPHDLLMLDRIKAGLPQVIDGPFEPHTWTETTSLLPADVDEVMHQLWKVMHSDES